MPALPAALVLLVLFVGGLLVAASQSGGYVRLLGSPDFRASLALTAWVATTSTAISAVLGLGVALWIHRLGGPRLTATLLQMPVAIPHLVFVVSVIHLLAPSGLLARVLHIPQASFPVLLNDRWAAGIILIYILKETPFLAVMCLAALVRIERDYDATARTLGATHWQRFRFVTLPLVAPVLAAGSAVVFAYVFPAFEVPLLLGRTWPAMLGVEAQRRFMEGELSSRPEAIAWGLVTALAALLVLAVATPLRKLVFADEETR